LSYRHSLKASIDKIVLLTFVLAFCCLLAFSLYGYGRLEKSWFMVGIAVFLAGLYLTVNSTFSRGKKASEKKILRSSRMYATISQVNKVIVYAQDQRTLFSRICEVATETGQFRMAWIGVIEKESRMVIPVAHSGHEEGYLSLMAFNLDEGPTASGPTEKAIRHGKHYICHSIKTDPLMAAWRAEALARDYQSSIALPVLKSGELFGTFNLYSREGHFFDGEEVDLLNEVVKDISFALEVFDSEASLKETERLLKESEERYRIAQTIGKMGHWELNLKNNQITWSDELYNIFEHDRSLKPLDYKSFILQVHPEDQASFLLMEEAIMNGHRERNLKFRLILKDGSTKYLHEQAKLQYDAGGRPVLLTGTVQDITYREEQEAEIRDMNEQLRELASNLQNIREEERTFIAREIHDELGQQLTAIKLDVSWLDRKIPGDEAIKQRIGRIISMLTDVLHSVRRIATQLRPSVLDDLGLFEALKWQTGDFQNRYGIPVAFECPEGSLKLDPGVTTGLFRILQEALTNIARHAEATAIAASICVKDRRLVLSVSDNGKGFEVNAVRKKKTLGLLGIKERTLMINGVCEIVSQPGKGTSLSVSVPLTTADQTIPTNKLTIPYQ
jgi:PAS domain S-box-containing protein